MNKLELKLNYIKCFKIKLDNIHKYDELLNCLSEYRPIINKDFEILKILISDNLKITQFDLDHISAMVHSCCSQFDVEIKF